MKLDRIPALETSLKDTDLNWNDIHFDLSFTISGSAPYVFNIVGHGLPLNNVVRFTNSVGGTMPEGLAVDTDYFVKNPSANTLEVSATLGGASIGGTNAATGEQRMVGYVSKKVTLDKVREFTNLKTIINVWQTFQSVAVGDTITVTIPERSTKYYQVEFYIDDSNVFFGVDEKTETSFKVTFDYLPSTNSIFMIVVSE